ncbi:hypothetical protein HZ326_8750 [Fusarium oxysporum f. sp. albedinis]|nr:hypothetical protein HZ326_8750 [Fusarium oxysporum f. sp. albedinis]
MQRKLHPDPSAPVRGVAPFSCFDSRPASPHKPDAYISWPGLCCADYRWRSLPLPLPLAKPLEALLCSAATYCLPACDCARARASSINHFQLLHRESLTSPQLTDELSV